jgi:hypothetical protein
MNNIYHSAPYFFFLLMAIKAVAMITTQTTPPRARGRTGSSIGFLVLFDFSL